MAYRKKDFGTITERTSEDPTLTTPALGTPASGVVTNLSGTLANGVQDNITRLGTVTQGNLQGSTWRRVNAVAYYGDDISHNSGLVAEWEANPTTGPSSVNSGFHHNSDSVITHTEHQGNFIAAEAGIYFVWAAIIPYTSAQSQALDIQKNGSAVTSGRAAAGNNHSTSVSAILIQLAATDYITVHHETAIHAGHYNNFFMWKIGEV